VLYGCALHDHRRRPGQTGFLEEWNEFYRELDSFLGLVRGLEPDAPVFLAGKHVSGQLALNYALHHPEGLSGVIAYAPSLRAPTARSPLDTLTRALSRIWPAFPPTVQVTSVAEPDLSAETLDRSNPSVQLSGEADETAVISSDISIPVLIVDPESPADSDSDSEISAGERLTPHSLTDVESWLQRVLSAATE
jgi:pimeloyl-ACP methyl ester carboxylesterase